jgi:class 3 adenylate cyclase
LGVTLPAGARRLDALEVMQDRQGARVKTCASCGTAGQADTAGFCFGCGSPLSAPNCAACGADLPAGARFCPGCGTPSGAPAAFPTQAIGPAHGTARKITSVLFGDLVGFTTLSESRDPEEVRELLTSYFDECRAVVTRYGGELEKFIGDAVMAVWGLPVTREDDAERAVRAGLELVERVAALGERIALPGLALRVGITTAEVAVTLGATGQGMVAGDAVNTAARIQSTAPPGQVWVDDNTRSFTSSAIAYDEAGAHTMKGKAEPVLLWAVRAVVAGARGDRFDTGLEAPLVGRDRELRLLKDVFHGVQETCRPGLLVVDGEPGIGKSRLSWEFEKYVDGFDASVLWHRGRCLSYGDGVAYYALAEAVRARLTIIADAEADLDSRQLLRVALDAGVPDEAERDWLLPRLAALLGVEGGGSFPREDLFVAWTAFFKYVGMWQAGTAAPQPVVLVVDDAQYADEGLLAFLEHLLAAADYPVFVLVLARPELLADHPALGGNRRVTVVHLEPLTTLDMTRLLDALVFGVPDRIRAELVERAEGIPLYAVETVRSLLDQDLVLSRGGQYVLADPAALDVAALRAPATMQALIGARLDTLPPEARRVVDQASVLGLVFTPKGIAAVCSDVQNLDEALSWLIRREVLRRDSDRLSADFGSYRFVQGVVRQVAYGTLSRRDRKATHLTVAKAFEAELESRTDAYELAPIIAQHYLDAIDAVPADPDVPELTRASSDHLVRAAARASSLGAPKEAAGYLTMALSRCAPELRLTIESRLGHELRRAADHAGAIEHATAAIKGFEAEGDLIAAAFSVEDLVRAIVYGEHDLSRAENIAREHLARLPDTPDTLSARIALVTALAAVLVTGDRDSQKQNAEEYLRLAELTGEPARVADSWVSYAISCFRHGLPHLSGTLLESAAELAGEHRALRVRALALVNLAGLALLADIPTSLAQSRDAVAVTRELGEVHMCAFVQAHLAEVLLHAGEWEESIRLCADDDVRTHMAFDADTDRRIIALAREQEWPDVAEAVDLEAENIEDPAGYATFCLLSALEAQAAGRPEAATLALRSVDLPHDQRGHDPVMGNWMFASQVVREVGGEGAIAQVLALVEDGVVAYPAGLRAQRSRLRAVLGQSGSLSAEAVEAAYVEALDLVRVWGSALFEAHTSADYGTWLMGQGRHEQGAALLGAAREFYQRVGAVRWLRALDRLH